MLGELALLPAVAGLDELGAEAGLLDASGDPAGLDLLQPTTNAATTIKAQNQ